MDPITHTASWLAPPAAGIHPLPADDADPVIALIAEEVRLTALACDADRRGDEIFDTLPEDIRKGRVQISFSDEFGSILRRSFASEADLHQLVAVHRRFARADDRVEKRRNGEDFDAAAADAEFDRIIGLDQALAQFRAGLEEIEAIRETSGCEAHYRETRDLYARASALADQILETKPTSLAGAIALLEWGNEEWLNDEGRLINVVIAGLRDLRAQLSADVVSLPT